MKVVILAGGLGSRLSEETSVRPKPLVELGGRPILWHIMKIYGHFGFTEFIICLGYKGYMIKEFFSNYFLHLSDVTFDLANDRVEVHKRMSDPWRVTLIETGENTQTGGRLKRVLPYIGDDEIFAMTYGDGVANIDLAAELRFHREHGRLATIAAVRPAKNSACSMWRAIASSVSPKSPRTRAAGSMAVSFCFRRRSAISLQATTRFGSRIR